MTRTQWYNALWRPREIEPVFDYQNHVHAELTTHPMSINLGDTVTVSATFFDDDGDMNDPDSGTATVTITNPDGTSEVATGSMTEDSDEESTFYYRHNVASSDTPGLWKAVVNADMTIDSETYKIVEKIYIPVEKA